MIGETYNIMLKIMSIVFSKENSIGSLTQVCLEKEEIYLMTLQNGLDGKFTQDLKTETIL